MKTLWTRGLDNQSTADIRQSFLSSRPIRKRLTDLCREKIEEHFKAQYLRKPRDIENWEMDQAYCMGYVKALSEVVSLLTEKDSDEILTKQGRGRPRKDAQMPNPLF